MVSIRPGDLDDPEIRDLLTVHVTSARAQSARESAHALDIDDLKAPGISFWAAWDGRQLAGVGALVRLSSNQGEIKSMHTASLHRRKGVGTAILRHIIAEARRMGLGRLSLETGSWPFFEPARKLYRRHGFIECPPFGSYKPDPNSTFMTLALNLPD